MTVLPLGSPQRLAAIDARHLTCEHPARNVSTTHAQCRTFTVRICWHCNSYQVVQVHGMAVDEPWTWDEKCRLLAVATP